jgi:hypothetical protein
MAKRCVPKVVRQRNGFDQVFVQVQRTGDRTAQLRHLQRVRHARAKQITFVVQEDLCFVDQASESRGVNDAVAVALMRVAHAGGVGGKLGFCVAAATGLFRQAGVGGEVGHCYSFLCSLSAWFMCRFFMLCQKSSAAHKPYRQTANGVVSLA